MPRPTPPGSGDPRRRSPETESSLKHKKGEIIQAARAEEDPDTGQVICYTAEGEQFRIQPPEYARDDREAFDKNLFLSTVADSTIPFVIKKIDGQEYSVAFADTAETFAFEQFDIAEDEAGLVKEITEVTDEIRKKVSRFSQFSDQFNLLVRRYSEQKAVTGVVSGSMVVTFQELQNSVDTANNDRNELARSLAQYKRISRYSNQFRFSNRAEHQQLLDSLQAGVFELDRIWQELEQARTQAESVVQEDAIAVYDAALEKNRAGWKSVIDEAGYITKSYEAAQRMFASMGMALSAELQELAAEIKEAKEDLALCEQEIDRETGKPGNKDVYDVYNDAVSAEYILDRKMPLYRRDIAYALNSAVDNVARVVEGATQRVQHMLVSGEPAAAFQTDIAQLRNVELLFSSLVTTPETRQVWISLVGNVERALEQYDTAHPPKTPEQIAAEQRRAFEEIEDRLQNSESALDNRMNDFRESRQASHSSIDDLRRAVEWVESDIQAIGDLLNVTEIDPALAAQMSERKDALSEKVQRAESMQRQLEQMMAAQEFERRREVWSKAYERVQGFLNVMNEVVGTVSDNRLTTTYNELNSKLGRLQVCINANKWDRRVQGSINDAENVIDEFKKAFSSFDYADHSIQPFLSVFVQIQDAKLEQSLPEAASPEQVAQWKKEASDIRAVAEVVRIPSRFIDRADEIEAFIEAQERSAVDVVEALGREILHDNALGTIDATNEEVQRILGIPQRAGSQKMMFVRVDAPTDPTKPYEIRVGEKQRSYAVSVHDIGELVQAGAIQMDYSPLAGGESVDRDWFADNYEGHVPFQVGERITYVLPEPYSPLDSVLLVQYAQYLVFNVNSSFVTLVPADSVDTSTGNSSGEQIVIDRDDFMIMLGYELSPDRKGVQRTGTQSIIRELESPDRLQHIVARGEPLFENQLRDIQSPMLEIGGVERMRFRFLQNILEGNNVVIKANQWLDVHADGFNDITQTVTAHALDARTGQPTGATIEIPYSTYAMAVSTEGLYEHWELYRAVEVGKMRSAYEQNVIITEPLDAAEMRRALIEHGVGLRSDGTFTRPEAITIKAPVNGEVQPVVCTAAKIDGSEVRVVYEVEGKKKIVRVNFQSFLDHFEMGLKGDSKAHVFFAKETAVWGEERMALFKAKYNLTDDFLKNGLSYDGQPAEFRFVAGQMKVYRGDDQYVTTISVDQFRAWYDDPQQPKILQLESYQHGEYFSTEWVQGLHGKNYQLLMNALVAGYELSDFEHMRNADTGEVVSAALVSPRLVQVTQGASTKRVALHTFLPRMLGDNPEYVPEDKYVPVMPATQQAERTQPLGSQPTPDGLQPASLSEQGTAINPAKPEIDIEKGSRRALATIIGKHVAKREKLQAGERNEGMRIAMMGDTIHEFLPDLYDQWQGFINGTYDLRAQDGSVHFVAEGRPLFSDNHIQFVNTSTGEDSFLPEFTFLRQLYYKEIEFIPVSEENDIADANEEPDTVESNPETTESRSPIDAITNDHFREIKRLEEENGGRLTEQEYRNQMGSSLEKIRAGLGQQWESFLRGELNISESGYIVSLPDDGRLFRFDVPTVEMHFKSLEDGEKWLFNSRSFLKEFASGEVQFVPKNFSFEKNDTDSGTEGGSDEAIEEVRSVEDGSVLTEAFLDQKRTYESTPSLFADKPADMAVIEALGNAMRDISGDVYTQYQAFLNGDMYLVDKYGPQEFDRSGTATHNFSYISLLNPDNYTEASSKLAPQAIIEGLLTGDARFMTPQEYEAMKNPEEGTTEVTAPRTPTLGESSGFF